LPFPLQNLTGGRSAEMSMRLVHAGQQDDVFLAVLLSKVMTPILLLAHLSSLQVPSDQPRHLSDAQSGRLDQKLPQEAPRFLGLLRIPVALQRLLEPLVYAGALGPGEVDQF